MTFSINSNHQLEGNGIDFKLSPNHSGKFAKGKLDTIIIHFTAGSSRASSVSTLSNPQTKASAHLVIGRDKKITQLVPFDTIAWHAGISAYQNRSGFNNFSIGIEIDNAGILTKNGDQYTSWFGKNYPKEDVFEGIHRNRKKTEYWHKYTQWQIEMCESICQQLIAKYDIKYILGHEEISPTRKIDPGPAFPLDVFRTRLLNNDRSSNEETTDVNPSFQGTHTVNTQSLNIRTQPDAESENASLPKGTKVKILEEKNGWVRVKTEIEGWVNKKYLKP